MKRLTDPVGFRTCSKCRSLKPVAEFHKNPRNVSGLSGYCKPCKNAGNLRYYRAHPEKNRAYYREYYAKNQDRIKAKGIGQRPETAEYQKAYRAENADRIRSSIFKRKYGISLEEYNAKLTAQGGGCGICKKSGHQVKGLAADHCHVTGKFRGILCSGCNAGLGMFQDDVELLKAAIQYRDSFRTPASAGVPS